jgi:hypothetical protein
LPPLNQEAAAKTKQMTEGDSDGFPQENWFFLYPRSVVA